LKGVNYNEKQLLAIDALAIDSPIQQVLYGGSAGSGKSFLGCDWQIKRRLKYANTRGLIGRSELKRLKQSTLKTFFERTSAMGLIPDKHFSYNQQDSVIRFNNGSEIILMDLADLPSDPEFQRFGSIEVTDYFVDEVTEVSKRCIDILHSRVRFNMPHDLPKGLMTCNPSKGWIYNEFYLAAKNGSIRQDRTFIQALPTDNPELSKTYLESLSKLEEFDRKRLLEGNWEYDDDSDKLFQTSDIIRCFRHEVIGDTKYITADIARFGEDRTIIVVWEGMTVVKIVELRKKGVTEVVDVIRQLMKDHNVILKNVLCDEDGVGGGAVDMLRCIGFVNGSRPVDGRYMNKKAECYYKLAQIVENNAITFIDGPKDLIIEELEMIKRHKSDSDGKLQVTPKDEIKRRTNKSPDYADAIMMRMHFELVPQRRSFDFV
jgi:phage terminase large subunit